MLIYSQYVSLSFSSQWLFRNQHLQPLLHNCGAGGEESQLLGGEERCVFGVDHFLFWLGNSFMAASSGI